MSHLLDLYSEFVIFRENYISMQCSKAVFSDHRIVDGVVTQFRPLTLINTEQELRDAHKAIATWEVMTQKLIESDPARYSPTSPMFKVKPQLVINPLKATVRVGTAKASRLMSKRSFLHKLNSMLKAELCHTDNLESKLTRALRKEIKAISEHPETDYRVKGFAQSEAYLYFTNTDGKAKRTRISQAGAIIYDESGTLEVEPPESIVALARNEIASKFEVKPIHTNLKLSAHIYRESELTQANYLKKIALEEARQLKSTKS